MLVWALIPLITLLWIVFIVWLLIRHFLQGASLLAYDHPLPDSHAGSRDWASPAHQEAVRLLERSSAEIRSVPRKQWLETVRRIMARG